jgi:hypothetical protein
LTKDSPTKGAVGDTYRQAIEIPPQKAAGVLSGQVFIPVRTPGNPPRRIRIPVTGIAYN